MSGYEAFSFILMVTKIFSQDDEDKTVILQLGIQGQFLQTSERGKEEGGQWTSKQAKRKKLHDLRLLIG